MKTILAAIVLLVTIGASPLYGQDQPLRTINHVSIGVGMGLNFVDLSQTMWATGKGIAVEGNWLYAPFVKSGPEAAAATKAGIVAVQSIIFLKLQKPHPWWTLIASSASNSLMVYVIHHNKREIDKWR